MTGGGPYGRLGGMTLTPGWRKAILTLHVTTAVGWLGVDVVLLVLGVAGRAGADPAVVYPAMGLIGRVLFVPLSLLAWLIGVVNAVGTPWGLVRHRWVLIKLVLTTLMLIPVLFLLLPNLNAAWELGAALPGRTRLDLVMAPAVSSTLLIVATLLSTYKPWGRTRWQPAVARQRVL
jgi:hypothetical protein